MATATATTEQTAIATAVLSAPTVAATAVPVRYRVIIPVVTGR